MSDSAPQVIASSQIHVTVQDAIPSAIPESDFFSSTLAPLPVILPERIQILNSKQHYLAASANVADVNFDRTGDDVNNECIWTVLGPIDGAIDGTLYYFESTHSGWLGLNDSFALRQSPTSAYANPLKIIPMGENMVHLCIGRNETVDGPEIFRYLGDELQTRDTAPAKPLEIRQPVLRREIFDIHYDIPSADIIKLTPMVVYSETGENPSADSDFSMALTYTYKKFESGTWNRKDGIEFGAKASFTAGVPGVASVTAEISIGTSIEASIGGTRGTEKTISETTQVTVKPKQKLRIVATISQAHINVTFTYTEKIEYSDGKTRTFRRNGVYRNVDSYNVVAVLEDVK